MKDAKLGDYLLWRGELAKIIGETDRRQVVIELLKDARCPNCNESLGKEQFSIIVSSPLFQKEVEEIPTITEDDSLIVK